MTLFTQEDPYDFFFLTHVGLLQRRGPHKVRYHYTRVSGDHNIFFPSHGSHGSCRRLLHASWVAHDVAAVGPTSRIGVFEEVISGDAGSTIPRPQSNGSSATQRGPTGVGYEENENSNFQALSGKLIIAIGRGGFVNITKVGVLNPLFE